MITATTLKTWQTNTGARGFGHPTKSDIKAVDVAIKEAIATRSDESYKHALKKILRNLLLVKQKRREKFKAAVDSLEADAQAELDRVRHDIADRAYREAQVVIDVWIDENLPSQISPDGRFNVIDEDAALRDVRRRCVKAELRFQHQLTDTCLQHVIESLTRSYVSANRYWSPGQKCHFVCEYCGLEGYPTKVLVGDMSGKSTHQKIELYVDACFRRNAGTGTGRIIHSILVDEGEICDPTWLQFFREVKPVGNFMSIFRGTEADFRNMFL